MSAASTRTTRQACVARRPWPRADRAAHAYAPAVLTAIAWPFVFLTVHMAAEAIVGPWQQPAPPIHIALTVLANGLLLALTLGGGVALRRGVGKDLRLLEPMLPVEDEVRARLERTLAHLPQALMSLAATVGAAAGLAVATLDPRLRDIHAQLSTLDPRYLLFVGQNVAVGLLIGRLAMTEVAITLGYRRLGERLRVDLLEVTPALAFSRKGLRSVIVWGLVSMAIATFWLLDSAGQVNAVLPVAVFALATIALIAPTMGARRSIVVAKTRELALIRDAIRFERAQILAPRGLVLPMPESRLAHLIQYDGFVRGVREWPFDLSTIWRSLLFILLGAGSWLGGALAERLLNVVLD